MANDYVVSIVLKAREEAKAAFLEVNAHLVEMVAAAKLANEELKRLNETATEHGNALHNMSLDTKRTADEVGNLARRLESDLTPAMNNSNNATRSGQSGLFALWNAILPGQAVAAKVALAIAAIGIALAPLTIELAASLVLFGAWVVGLTAFLGVVAIVGGGIVLLAAGMAALGIAAAGGLDPLGALEKAQKSLATATNQTEAAQEAVRLAQLRYDAHPTAVNLQVLKDATEQLAETQKKQVDAQNAVNAATVNANAPLSQLHEKIVAMGQAWGQQAVPFVQQAAAALITLLPQVQAMGNAIFAWFGPRFPEIMNLAMKAVQGLFGVFTQLAQGWATMADAVLSHPLKYEQILGTLVELGTRGILGLLDNLMRLSDWFIARFPVLEKNAESTFANLGTAVQLVGTGLGMLVDWVIAHWPAINAMFDASWNAFKQGWAAVQPVFGLFLAGLQALQPVFLFIEQHADNLKVVYFALGAAVAIVVAALGALFLIVVLVTGAIVALGMAVHAALDTIHAGADNLSSAWNGAKDAVGKALDAIIGKHASVGQSAKDAAKDVATATGDMQGDWRKTAGPGTDSIEDSTGRIVSSMGGVATASSGTATQVHTDTGKMGADYGQLSQGAEQSGSRIRADNTKTQQSSTQAATGMTAIWDWASKVIGESNHQNGIAFAFLRDTIVKSMGDNIGAVDAFEKEHLKTAGSHERLNTREGEMFNWLSKTIGQSMSDNGSAVRWFMEQNAAHSASIERDNRQQGINWNQLSIWIGQSMDQNGKFISDFGVQMRRLSDFTDYVVFKVMGPAFSDLGRAVREMGKAVGDAFSGLGSTISSGLHTVAGVINTFGTAVTNALGVFNVQMAAVRFAQGGVVPGYAPGQDSVLAMLSPGEGVLTPQTVRAMGGAPAIAALNEGTDKGAGAFSIGAWGGQCVEFLQRLLGLTFHGNANQWVNAPYAHTQTGAPGELAVFTGGWYGHLALVTKMITDSIFEVLDSNWVAPETIGQHTMSKSMYGFATFLNPGISAPGGIGQFLAGIPGITSPADLLNGLVSKALGGLGGWEGALAKGILGKAVTGITHHLGFDQGGGLPPGGTYAWNNTGRTETVTPAITMDDVVAELRGIRQLLAQLAGQPRLGAQMAMARTGG